MKKLSKFLMTTMLVLGAISSQAQITVNAKVNNAMNLHVSDTAHTFTISFGLSASITGGTMNIAMPAGIEYVPGSIVVTSGAASFTGPTGPASSPVFTMSAITGPTSISLTYKAKATCGAVATVIGATPLRNNVTITPASGAPMTHTTMATYNVNYGVLNWTSGWTNDPFTGNVGSSFVRQGKISNSGNGVISKFFIDAKYNSAGVRLDSVTLAPGIAISTTRIGDSTVVYVNMAAFTPAQRTAIAAYSNSNGGNMNADTIFHQNTTAEVMVVNYYHKVLGCSNNGVTYKGHYGDNLAANCLNGTEADKSSNIVINAGGPNVIAKSLSVVSDTMTFKQATICSPGRLSAMWINNGVGGGAGFAKDFEPAPSYHEIYMNWLVDTINGNFYNARIYKNGTSVPLAVYRQAPAGSLWGSGTTTNYYRGNSYGYWKVPANTITSDPDGPGGFSDLDGDGFFDDVAVGDTVKLTWEVSSWQNPSDAANYCAPLLYRQVYGATSRYQNQCALVGNQGPSIDPSLAPNANATPWLDPSGPNGRYLSYNTTNAIATGASRDISPGQSLNFTFNVPNHYDRTGLFNVCKSYQTRLVIIPPAGQGFSVTGASTYNGRNLYGTAGTGSNTIAAVGDSFIVSAPAGVNAVGSFDANISFSCITPVSNVSIKFRWEHLCIENGCTTITNFGCGTLDLTTHGCALPCPNGISTISGSVARTTFGFTNTTRTTKVTASTPGVRVDRVLVGDTVNVKSNAIMTAGASYNNGNFRLEYKTPVTGINPFTFTNGTVKLYDASAGTSATVALPSPTTSVVGGLVYYNFNINTLLGGTALAGLNTLDANDSFNVDLNMVMTSNAGIRGVLNAYDQDIFRMRHWVDSNGVQKSCDAYNGSLQLWDAELILVNNASTITGCDVFNNGYGVYDVSQWANMNFFPNELRPYNRIDTLKFDMPFDVTLDNPTPVISYLAQLSTSYYKSGTSHYFIRSGGWWMYDDEVSTTIYLAYKNSCRFGGLLKFGINGFGTRYKGNTPYAMNETTNDRGPSSQWNSNNYIKATLNIQPIATKFVGINSPASWDVRICNQNTYTAGKPWIAFELPVGVTAVSIEDVTSGAAVPMTMKTYGSGKVFAQFPTTMTSLACFTARIKATYTSCTIDTIKAITGFDCDTLVGNPDLNSCNKWNTKLVLEPATTSFQINKIVEPLAPQQLCTDTMYNLEVLNVNAATARDLKFQVTMPVGSEIVPSSSQASYILQSGGSYLSLPDPVFIGSGVYEYNLSSAAAFSSTLGANGLVGAGSPPNNKFNIRFSVRTNGTCQYVSGSQFKFRMTGDNPCGSEATPFTSTSNLFIINGAPVNPNAFGIIMGITDTVLSPCATPGTNVVKFKAVNFGPAATSTAEKIRLTLPTNVTFNTGSYTSIRNSVGAPTVTTVGGQQQLDWTMNAGVVVGDSFVFTIVVTPSSALTCGSVNFDARTLVTFTTTCISSGTNCTLASTTGSLDKAVSVVKPSFAITAFTGSSVPNGGAGETVTANVSVMNIGVTNVGTYYVKIYNDGNLNGTKDATDILLDSILISSPHNAGATISASKTFNVGPSRACPLIAYIDSGSCVCDKTQRSLSNIRLANALRDTALCSGSSTIMGATPVVGYTYLWDPSTDLSNSSAGNPLYTANNATTAAVIQNYILTTSRGGCTSFDTIVLTANPIPQGLDIAVSNTCIKSATTLTASSTSSGVTYTWKIDGTAAGSGVSITPTLTAGSHSVEITATLANGCKSVFTKSFIFYDINISATTSASIVCQGGTATLTANSSNAVGYAWYKYGSSIPFGFTPTIGSGAMNDSTTYKVIVTNGTCKDSATVFVDVVKTSLTARADTTICPGSSVILSVPVTYNAANWVNLTDATGTSGLSYTVTPTATTKYRVVASTASPVCSSSDTVTVTVRAVTLPVISGVRSICSGTSSTYTAAPTGTSPVWSASTGSITSGGVFTAPSVTSTTSAILTYSHTDVNGCMVMDTHNITINPLPVVSITSSNASMCSGQTRTLSGTPSGGTFSGTGVAAGVFTAPATAGNYVITYSVTDANGCIGTSTQSITVNAPITLTAVTFSPGVVCNGSTTSASATPAGGTWSVVSGPGTINAGTGLLTTSGTALITVRYSHPGVPGASCANTIDGTITPVARPTVAPSASPATICNGASSTIAANAAGGSTPYTYAWSAGSGASHTASPTSNTTYNVTVTDNNSCTASGSVTLTVTGSTPLAADAGTASAICNGASTSLGGSPTGTGGAGGYSYSWASNPAGFTSTAANPTASPTATTTYTVTVTSSSCTVSSSVVVTVNPRPSVAPSASPSSICNGQSSTIAANATGGTAPLTYTWNIGSGGSHSQSPTATTAYNVTVTDNNTCSATGTVTVNVTGSTPLAADAGSARAICNGASTSLGGSPTGTGGAGAYTYSWTSSPAGFTSTGANPSASPTATTTYTVTVTSSSCTVASSVVVTVNPRPTVAPTATPSSICNGQSSTIAANGSGGTGTLTYTWSPFGTGASHTQSPSTTTSYNVTVSDANSCTASGSVTLNVIGISPLSANAGTSRTICSGVSTNLGGAPTATGGSGGYTYSWSSSPAGFTSAAANPTASPTATTTYTVTVTSSTCTATNTVVVTVNPSPSVAPSASLTTICNGQSTTISANATGGTPTLTYAWNNGSGASHTASPTSNTTYIVTVTDANSCTATGSVSVTVTGSTPLAADAGSARAICNGASTNLGGSPTGTGGAGGYTYSWASNPAGFSSTTANPTASPTATTTYTVTVTSSGCTATSSVVVTVNPKPTVSPSASPSALCNGQSTTISANAAGGTGTLTYSWTSGSGASFTATPSSTTSYSVTVTDANGCTATGSVTVVVTGTSPLVAVAGTARAICNGSSTTLGGSPTSSGGAGSPTFSWSGGAGTTANPVVSPSATTTYRVTVTSSGCTAVDSVVVTVNSRPNVAPSASPTTICFGASSTVSANSSLGAGTTGALIHVWTPSGSGASFTTSPSATTIFNVEVTDVNGCKANGSVSVGVTGSSPLTATAGTNRTICEGSSTNLGSTPTGNGGNASGTYTYSWSSAPAGFTSTAANPTVSPTATTTYTVTVTNTGCTATSTVIVSVNPKPSAAPSASVNPVCSGSNTTITANASGGTAPYTTYQWNTSQTSASFVASPTTTVAVVNAYTVTVTDVNNCTVSATINVNVTPLPVMTAIANQSVCIPATGGKVSLSAAALTAGQTGAWTTITSPSGAVSFTAANSPSTDVNTVSPINTYTFRWTITETGCSNWTNTNVTVNESPVINAGDNDTICNGNSKTLSATLTSVSPATINWKANSIASTPFAFTTTTTVSPVTTTNYIFTAAISPCIVSDTVNIGVINKPDLLDDMTACQMALEDVQATIPLVNLTANDNNAPVIRGGMSYAIGSVKHGVASISGSNILYKGDTNYYGKDTVQLIGFSTECILLRDTAIFCITVDGLNDKPTVLNDIVKAIGKNPKTFNPLGNDSDIESTLLGTNITILSPPKHGTYTGPSANGEMVYTSDSSNFAGLDTIKYEVCDTGIPLPAKCDAAFIIVQIVPQIDDVTKNTTPGSPITIGTPITLGPGVTMTPNPSLSGPSKGSGVATINPTTGVVTFTPSDTPFIGKDTIRRVLCFTYPVGDVVCDTSVIYIDNPSVKNVGKDTTPMNTPKTLASLKPYKFEGGVATTTSSPSLTVNPSTGAVTYTPKPGFVGVDTAKVTRCDSKGNCVTDVYVMTVLPNLKDTVVTVPQGLPVTLKSPITKYPGQTMTTTVLTNTKKGTAVVNPDGSVTYTSNPNFTGKDTLIRIICIYDSASMLTFCDTIKEIFDVYPHKTNPDVAAGNKGETISGNVKTNDNVKPGTIYGSPIAASGNPSSSIPTMNPDGKYTFSTSVPGVYVFTVPVCPPGYTSGCPLETLTITIVDPERKDNKPILTADKAATKPNTPVKIDVLVNDASGNVGGSMSKTSVTVSAAPKNGAATVNADGTINYTPNAGFVGFDTFYYSACDNSTPANCGIARVIVNVTNEEIADVQDDVFSGSGVLTGNTLANDKFPSGSKPNVKAQTEVIPGKGTFVIDAAGNYTWTPIAGFTGAAQVIITTCDGLTPETCYTSTVHILTKNNDKVEIPNYFSPNGDGINDVWNLDDLLNKYPNAKAMVYNRWGNVVWRSTGPYGRSTTGKNLWHGQLEGSQDIVPDGVYYYLLELEDEFKTSKTGFIEIMRQ